MKPTLPGLAACAVLALAGGAFAAPAQPEIRTLAQGAASPAAKAGDLDMIAGDWVSPSASIAFSRAQAGEIVGHLYIHQNDKPGLHELWTIKPLGSSLALYQVFFQDDLAPMNGGAWQERKLVAVDRAGGKVFFEGTTLSATGETLKLEVRLGNGNLIVFGFTRAK